MSEHHPLLRDAFICQSSEMVDDDQKLFRQIPDAFLGRHEFVLPEIFEPPPKRSAGAHAA